MPDHLTRAISLREDRGLSLALPIPQPLRRRSLEPKRLPELPCEFQSWRDWLTTEETSMRCFMVPALIAGALAVTGCESKTEQAADAAAEASNAAAAATEASTAANQAAAASATTANTLGSTAAETAGDLAEAAGKQAERAGDAAAEAGKKASDAAD